MSIEINENILNSLLGTLKAHIAVLDMDGTIVYVNKTWRLFGAGNGMPSQYEPVGTNYLEMCGVATDECPDEASQVTSGIRELMAGEREEFFLKYPCHAPDQKRWFQMRVCVFHSEGQSWLLVTHEDITEVEIVRLAQSNLFHVLSHDLRTPLNVFQGYASIFDHEELPSAEETVEVISLFNQASIYLAGVVNNMLSLSSFENGKDSLAMETCNYRDLLQKTVALVEPLLRGTTIEVEVPDLFIMVDQTKIQQVLINLLGNALKFSSGGVIKIDVKVADCQLTTRIRDQGKGIAPEHLDIIFNIYEQTMAGEQAPGSSGLGLYICKKFIELHDGKIWAESKVGEGSTFIFQLPVCR